MREILSDIAPLMIPMAVSLLVLMLAALIAGICARRQSLQRSLLSASFAFFVALLVFLSFGVAVTLMTIKDLVIAGGS